MLRIAHTADIHWRGLSRHDEYREVFKFFVEDCKKNNVDHIFIGGDIFHTKTTGISPEYIEQLSWWLDLMSQVAPVHLILGNHDGNLVNLSRQDAVSPIVSALNNKNIFLYKKSGCYEFSPGYVWNVFSPFDEESWKDVKPQPDKINIACFHGPIRGSVTEVGWNLEEGKTVEFFNEYDYAFLGDIHKHQYLGYRNGKPWVGYPGTPIQQNYAEDINHGYLLWQIESSNDWDVEFRKLPNLKPFVTLPWQGSLEELHKDASKFPKGTRFRIRSAENISQKDTRQISNLLVSKFGASEVTHKSDVVFDRTVIKAGAASLVKTDLRSHDVLMRLIKDNYKNSTVTEDMWKSVAENVKSIISSVSTNEDVVRNSKWSLRYLGFDNMFTYGEENLINFDQLNGIVGIFGSNRIGKSSIVGTIMYSLFNTTDRGPMKNLHVCNVRKPYCSSKAVICHNGTDYVVERQTTKSENKKGVVTASTALNLYKIRDDGEAEELNGEQRNDTEKIVRNLIGSPEDFLMTSLSAQGEINQFIMQGSTKRRAILSRFLDLDVFDKMYEIVNKESNGIKYQLKSYPEKDWNSIIEQSEEELQDIENLLETSKQQKLELQNEVAYLQSELHNHGNASPVTVDQINSQIKKIEQLEIASEGCSQKISQLEIDIAASTKKIKTIQDLKKEYNLEDLKRKKEVLKNLESSLLTLRHTFDKEETLLKQHQKSLKILDEVPCGDEYPTCKFIKDAHDNKKKLSKQTVSVSLSKKNLDSAIESLDAIKSEGSIENLEKLEKLIDLESKLELEVSKKETELAKTKLTCDSKMTELQSAKDRLGNLEAALKNTENAEVVTIRAKLEELLKTIKEHDDNKLAAATKKGRLAAFLEKTKEEKSSRDALLEKLKINEIISFSFSKKGLPLTITKSQLPVINSEIAKILQGIVDFSIELENDEDSDSAEIYINYGDSRRVIELCSGMEKTIASLAVRVAMINISSLPRPDMFIIDEGFGTLDDAAVESCNRLLTSLKRYFRTIIVITHVDGIKDAVDHVLEITKNEKDAKVIFGGD